MSTATLSSKFQISIPKEVRETLNLKPGQKLAFLCIGKSVKLVPQLRIEDLFGIAKGANPDGYRDRSTRREDQWPKLTPAQVEQVKSNLGKRNAASKTKANA
jgi:AbrB family looped-hinge helix DNA binding protein